MAEVIPIPLGITKAFLVKDEGAILVDTGSPNDENRIVAALHSSKVAPEALKLILLTHGHYDHCGSTRKLRDFTSAPVAIHERDVALLKRGRVESLTPIAFGARLVKLISFRRFLPDDPDVVITQEMDLRAYGVNGKILFTPGHTAGSISVLLAGGEAIVGDLMVGGYLGGFLFPGHPGYHYFADDVAAVQQSIRKLMALNPKIVYVAHGGPLQPAAIRRRFAL